MKKKFDFLTALSLISQIGFMMAVPIIFGVIFGNYIDNKLNTGIVFLLIFSLLGIGAAFRNLYILTTKALKNGDKRKDQK
ncbi:MAG TPA: AtpZ/AtpI family protein [Defluviitaleaceae bacterium]|jgi:ATP synthase protein I|nr:AtpZ/AtpI family protein [Candidatus Epulonipiscium sp.]HOQ16736.1 AtpZ/AtpI family protein [Defluviitaleaceae bacterium]HPT75780.1 AtpZ/AtpI family protein [Defluviitaleaceae bacterium]HQD51473.1 AtpZ/AtpI family protein [Defluviitaleaceae bacterium]